MLVKELRDRMIRDLSEIYPENESIAIVKSLLLSVAGIGSKDLVMDPDLEFDDIMVANLSGKMTELLAHKPLQYVTGLAYFFGLELEVNPAVLIPRPETEELVKWIADDCKNARGLRILDIGTGSGCIILALGKLLPEPRLTVIDISRDALNTASANADRYSIPVDFLKLDILDQKEWDRTGNFDIIVSNPPYVRLSEKEMMKPNVLDYEPHNALFVPDDDPLVFYRRIAGFARSKLNANGYMYLEINENLGEEVVRLLFDNGFSEVILKKDMYEKDRLIKAQIARVLDA